MARDLRVKVRLTADTKQATTSVNRFKTSFGSLRSAMTGFAVTAAVVGVAIGKLVSQVNKWVAAANVQEDAISGLNAQLAKFGPIAGTVSQALQEQASALQLVTRFGDEVTIAAQAQLAVFAKSGEGIKALTVASQDFATAQGIDLVSAAKLLGKTLGSSTNALIRYGIEVEGAAGSSERLESLTSNIATLFSGRAREAAETYAGVLERVSNAQGDLAEKMGGTITNSEDLTFAQKNLAFGLEKLNAELDTTPGLIARVNTGWVNLKAITVAALIAFNNLGKSQAQIAIDAKEVAAALKQEAVVMETAEQKAKRLAAASVELVASQNAIIEAAGKVTAALGETTSVELSNQIFDITLGLKAQAEILGENSDEYVRLERVATEKIALLKDRVLSLRDGLGDLKAETEGTVSEFEALGDGFDFASDRATNFGSSVDSLRGKLDGAIGAATRLNSATGSGGTRARDPLFDNLESNSLGAFRTQSGSRSRRRVS